MTNTSARGWFRRVRLVVAWLVPFALLIPVYATVPRTEWAGRIWWRVAKGDRIRLGDGKDQAIRTLVPFLPQSGDIGFSNAGGDPTDESRFRVQYGLAPRRVLNSTTPEFVVETGSAERPAPLSHSADFALVFAHDTDLRLYRRIQR